MNSRPLITAMMRRDRRKHNHLFTQMESGVNTSHFFQALHAHGYGPMAATVRQVSHLPADYRGGTSRDGADRTGKGDEADAGSDQ